MEKDKLEKPDRAEGDVEGEVSEKDSEGYRWLRKPAVFCDYFSVEAWKSPGIVRFAFGEFTGESIPPLYRMGMAMPIAIAKMLLEELAEVIERAEKEETEPAEK